MSLIFFLAIFAAINLVLQISQHEDLIQLLLNGGDTAGVLTADDVLDLLRERQNLLLHNLLTLDDIHGDVVIDEAEDVQVQGAGVTFYLQDILFPHLVAAGIFDDGDAAVQLIQLQIVIELQAHAGLDVIEHKALGNCTNI